MLTLIAVGIGITGMFRRALHNKLWMALQVLTLMLLAPTLTLAEVSIMKTAPARGLIGSDGSQPVSLSTDQWAKALGSIRYADDRFLASSGPKPVFSDQQVHALAPQIRQVFANIGTGQAVVFHQDKVRGAVFFSSGRLYWYFSGIENDAAFKLTDMAEEDARTSYAVEAIPEDDIDVSYWRLLPQEGQSIYRSRPDMLAMPVSTLTPDTALLPVARSRPSVRIQSRPVTMADTDAVSRIGALHRLLGKDLISKDEYRKKLEAIIPEYMTQHPSPDAGLEFLRVLNKKGLIAPDMLQQQRALLLDRL